mmetsp:Transcript_25383/g.33941  ORF Transcript_25383/g.33941 Transcript_25383/m.33941 type:complete len:100 (+) Transcript_25383:196-495(+)
MMGGEAKLSPDVRRNLINHTCLKAILYISKSTAPTTELQERLLTTFNEIPLVVVRANTLPKNAPIELEMMALATKSEHKVVATPNSLSVRSKADDRLIY